MKCALRHPDAAVENSLMYRAPWLIAVLLAALLAGCGSGDWGTGTGTVSVDGTPLKAGVVTFHPRDGGAAAYGQVSDGKYTLYTGQQAGLKVGEYQVTVSATSIPEPGSTEKAKLLTPAKYAQPATSGLTEKVKAGANAFDLKLSSAP
jgi:hypothetical protein